MSEKKEINILMVDKQALKLGDPLAEFLNMSEEYLCTIRICYSYTEALSMLEGVDIALIELDLTREYFMPGDKDFLPWIKDENAGYRFLVYLKREHPDIKVIMLVDYPACEEPRSEMPEILDKGADGYMVKPFVISELVEKIHRISLT
ncbi:MAG: hypothetical protein FD151_1462 [bacterium]|nr:MAG: hypothetical protein FD151_1462 [bacterium]